MSTFNPDNLYVKFISPITPVNPVFPRRYTLTHSDVTARLFLTIGPLFDITKITSMRDEVLGEWTKKIDKYFFNVYLRIDPTNKSSSIELRNKIFRQELPLALAAIRYGDRKFFDSHPELNDSPIAVYFKSKDKNYNRIEIWGTFSDYYIH